LSEVVVGESAAGFDDADPVAFLGQSQGTHTSAEPRADDRNIEPVGLRAERPLWATLVAG
jgi:hypothetical protein